MKTILYMAISVDGKTTGKDKDIFWVSESDIERMDELIVFSGVMVVENSAY